MNLSEVKIIHQVSATTNYHVTKEVNAYLDYGWEIVAINQWTTPEDGQTACPIFVLGHRDAKAKRPTQDVYSKKWS